MLEGEEKKDNGNGYTLMETTPNPLASNPASSVAITSSSVPMPIKIEIPAAPPPPPSQPAAAAAATAAASSSSVPNPMMTTSSSVPFNHSRIQSPPPMANHAASATAGAMTKSGATSTAMDTDVPSSAFPSPLSSPVFSATPPTAGSTSSTAAAAYYVDNHHPTAPIPAPPSRPPSALSVGTSASDMNAMVASALDTPILEETAADGTQQPPTRRRRANTIHWATAPTSSVVPVKSSSSLTNSPPPPPPAGPGSTPLQSNESLQPVNFGGHPPPPATRVASPLVQFSPGSGGTSTTATRVRKLSNASSSASSLGLRTASSNSLYSEYSHDSTSPIGHASPGAATASPQPAPPTSMMATVSMGPGTGAGPVVGAGPGPGAGAPTSVGVAAPVPFRGVVTKPSHVTTATSRKVAPTTATANTTSNSTTGGTVDKRQKRLERNRESARASRRRRKQYLEELETKVNNLSLEMDRGRLNHACMGVRTIRGMRLGKVRELERTLALSTAPSPSAGLKNGKAGGVTLALGSSVGSGKANGGNNAAAKPAMAAKAAAPFAPSSAGTAAAAALAAKNRNTRIKGPVRSGIAHNVTSVPTPLPPNHPSNHHYRSIAAAAASSASAAANPTASLEQQLTDLTSGGKLSRTSDELQIAQTFLKQQLMSLVQPTSSRFVLWLTLQKDGFYRGGRSASERLSAARIGERLLHSGNLRASPRDGMWPLVCHEVGLSYDQEERIRQCQRTILANGDSWVHRHTAQATKSVVESIHDVIGGAQEAAKQREKTLMNILTPEQRIKFLAWASRKQDVVRRLAEAEFKTSTSSGAAVSEAGKTGPKGNDGIGKGKSFEEEEYQTSPDRHVAANFYIINHRLSKVKQRIPPNTPTHVHPSKLKKLSRRPSFESLAGHQSESDGNNPKLNRETSFPSTGSLKRSLNDVLVGGAGGSDNSLMDPNHASQNAVTPETAQAAAHSTVMAVLKDILPIVPKSALQYPMIPPKTVPSSSTIGLSPIQTLQPVSAPTALPQPLQPTIPQQYPSIPVQATSAGITAPSPNLTADDIDIPMPTPVSVLLRTSDDFIPSAQYQEPLEPVVSSSATNDFRPDFVIPEQVASYGIPENAVVSAGPALGSVRSHQSAPQLAIAGGGLSPSPTNFSQPSYLQAPMEMIPESTLVNNPIMGQGGRDIVDFALEDLPEMEADDWAIEGFDMDVDQQAAP
mmetsp:Transcript_17230/g.36340  ORF Transcript_17230/g.36340 Transcript_17230/m.36340 type:complete len:1203 (-) Transcript_17230:560-4168(-)